MQDSPGAEKWVRSDPAQLWTMEETQVQFYPNFLFNSLISFRRFALIRIATKEPDHLVVDLRFKPGVIPWLNLAYSVWAVRLQVF